MNSIGRIPTTHVGSLVRPPELVSFLKAQQNGEPSALKTEISQTRSVADPGKCQAGDVALLFFELKVHRRMSFCTR